MAEVFFTVATGKSVAAGVAAAAVLTAAMAAFVIVVITSGIVCIGEGTGQQFGYPLIGVTGAAGVEPDPGFRQGHLGAGADAAADQAVYLLICQEAGQRTMAAAVGVHDLRGDHLASRYIIELELLRMAEMLKNRSVLISHCNFHVHVSFLLLRDIRRRIRRKGCTCS